MELTQVISDILYYYFIFCLVTAICIVYLNIKIFRVVNPPLNWYGKTVYFGVIAFLAGLFAPAFFLIFIFYSRAYMDNAVVAINKVLDKRQENS